MRSKRFLLVFQGLLTLGPLMINSPALAAIALTDIAGMHSAFSPETAPYFSPVQGAIAVESGVLQNIRFRGFYGAPHPNTACEEKFLNPKDPTKSTCPQDATAALVQRLFPSADGVVLVPNQLTFDPISMLTPAALGKLLGQIYELKNALHRDSLTHDPTFGFQDFKDRWVETQLREIHSKTFSTSFLKDYDLMRTRIEQTYSGNSEESIQIRMKELRDLRASVRKRNKKWKSLDDFAGLVYQAVLDSLKVEYPYPRQTVEHAFLAYLWMKAQSKESFIPYYQNIPVQLRSSHRFLLSDEPSTQLNDWTQASYKPTLESFQSKSLMTVLKNFFGTRDQLTELFIHLVKLGILFPKDQAQGAPVFSLESSIAEDPELSTIMGYALNAYFSGPAVLAGYGLATHPALENGESFSDCVETSIRNFLNFILLNPAIPDAPKRKFDILAHQKGLDQIKPGLIQFYQEFGSVHQIRTQAARNAWIQLVTSELKGVEFKNPKNHPIVNMNPRQSNVLIALGEILGDDILRDPKVSPSDKWTRICTLFSRTQFELDWALEGETDRTQVNEREKGIKISIWVNGKKFLYWDFFETHHVTLTYAFEAQKQWNNDLIPTLIDRLKGVRERRDISDLAFYLNSKDINHLHSMIQKIGAQDLLPIAVFKLNDSSTEDAFLTLDLLIEVGTPHYDFLIERLVDRIADVDDLFTQAQLFSKLKRLQKKRPVSEVILQRLQRYEERSSELVWEGESKAKHEDDPLDGAERIFQSWKTASAQRPKIKTVRIADRNYLLNSENRCITFPFPQIELEHGILLQAEGVRKDDQYLIQLKATDSGIILDDSLNPHQFIRKVRNSGNFKTEGFTYTDSLEKLRVDSIVFFSGGKGDVLSFHGGIHLKAVRHQLGEFNLTQTSGNIVLESGRLVENTSALRTIQWKNRDYRYMENKVLMSGKVGALGGLVDFAEDRFNLMIWNIGNEIEFCFN